MDPELQIKYQLLSSIIDELDYYQILKIPQTASLDEIKTAYHAESREFHPDNYSDVTDPEMKEMILKVSKRITEAYTTLRDHEKRKRYDTQISLPPDQRKLRYSEESSAAKPQQPEDGFATPQGRRLYNQGVLELKMGKWNVAERTLKLALSFEPGNQLVENAIQAAMKSGPQHMFAIKLE
jgi:DnaJ-class molecular chaperone